MSLYLLYLQKGFEGFSNLQYNWNQSRNCTFNFFHFAECMPVCAHTMLYRKNDPHHIHRSQSYTTSACPVSGGNMWSLLVEDIQSCLRDYIKSTLFNLVSIAIPLGIKPGMQQWKPQYTSNWAPWTTRNSINFHPSRQQFFITLSKQIISRFYTI